MINMLKTLNVPGIWRQLATVFIVCIGAFVCGMETGWTSTIIPKLQKENNTMGIVPLTLNEASWLISAYNLPPLVFFAFSGAFSERFGRKATILMVGVPYICSWLLKLLSKNFYHLLAAQILRGAGDCLALTSSPMYISEIASVSVRGFLTSFVLFNYKIGLLVGLVSGTVLSYQVFAIIGLVISIAYIAAVLPMWESPVWLVRHRQADQAEKSLMWLRCNDKATVDVEMTRLQEFNNEKVKVKSLARLRELFRDRAVFRGQVIGIILALGQQLGGIKIVMLYTVPIFDAAQISIDSYLAAILIGVMQLIGISLSTAIIEQTGRRPLLFISSTGVILCHTALGTFFLLQSSSIDLSSFSWLPVVAMSTYAVIFSIGLGPMYFTVSNEAYHPDAASFCNSVSFFIMELSGFFLAKFYPIIGAAIGLHYCFFILVIFCICILLAIIVYVPETKGKTKESILDELRSRRGIFNGIFH